MRAYLTRTLAVVFVLLPTAALAHVDGTAHGFAHGFVHPFGGLDHLLAMVAVGILAWQLGGGALWLLPASFLAVLAAGGALALTGVTLPLVEVGVAASVIALGAMVALGFRAPIIVAMALTGLFALFHGYAHGAEMPAGASGGAYAAGFLLATALLHLSGIAIGILAGRLAGRTAYQLAGGTMAAVGIVILSHVV